MQSFFILLLLFIRCSFVDFILACAHTYPSLLNGFLLDPHLLERLDFSKHVDVFEAVGGGGAITLVYVHGGGGSREMFKPHARAMAAKNFRLGASAER